MSDELESLLTYCRERSRVCPMPDRWNELWEILPGREHTALPLILGGWWDSGDGEKAARLAEHLA